jgi:hypothetical protein
LAHLYIDILRHLGRRSNSGQPKSNQQNRLPKKRPAKPKPTITNHNQTITKPTMTKPKPTIKTSHPRYLHGVWGGAPFQKLFHFLTLFPAP